MTAKVKIIYYDLMITSTILYILSLSKISPSFHLLYQKSLTMSEKKRNRLAENWIKFYLVNNAWKNFIYDDNEKYAVDAAIECSKK